NFFLLRSISSDLKRRSSELICWLTADWVTQLTCAALVKLSVSARSQKTFKLSICISQLHTEFSITSQLMFIAIKTRVPLPTASVAGRNRFGPFSACQGALAWRDYAP